MRRTNQAHVLAWPGPGNEPDRPTWLTGNGDVTYLLASIRALCLYPFAMPRSVLCALAAVVAAASSNTTVSTCDTSSPDARSDCGVVGTTQQTCLASGCCWGPVSPNPNDDP